MQLWSAETHTSAAHVLVWADHETNDNEHEGRLRDGWKRGPHVADAHTARNLQTHIGPK